MLALFALFRLHSRVGEPAVCVPGDSCAAYHVSTEASLKLAGGAVLLFGVTTNPARTDGAQVGGSSASRCKWIDIVIAAAQRDAWDGIILRLPHMAVATTARPQLPQRPSSQYVVLAATLTSSLNPTLPVPQPLDMRLQG